MFCTSFYSYEQSNEVNNHLYLKIGPHFDKDVLHINMIIKIFTFHQQCACNLDIIDIRKNDNGFQAFKKDLITR